MEIRHRASGEPASTIEFNTHGLGEILVYFDDGSASSEMVSDYDVLLPNGEWKTLGQALKDHDVISDNFNQYLAFPTNDLERERGWYE